MSLERDSNLKIITEVKKFECLYNFNLADYSKKDVTERAWIKVSKKMNLPVHECKDKWKNIRSALVRTLKPNAMSKLRKRYYLHEYLTFLLPFVKHIPTIKDQGTEPQVVTKIEDTVMFDDEESSLSGFNLDDDHQSEEEPPTPLPSTSTAKRKAEDSMESLLDFSPKKETCSSNNTSDDDTAKKYFLLSLLPELKGLNEDQMRHFKIQTLLLIDNIKGGCSTIGQLSTYTPKPSPMSSISIMDTSQEI